MPLLRSFLALLSVAACVTTVSAERVATYRFVPTGEPAFGFRGGLIHGREGAVVEGSFDVTHHEDGTATLTRFEATFAAEPITHNLPVTGVFAGGGLLADLLYVDPVGAPGEFADGGRDVSFLMLAPREEALSPAIMIEQGIEPVSLPSTPASTNIALSGLGEAAIRVRVNSTPASLPDNPAFSTQGFGLVAVLIPEPAGVLIATTMIGLVWSRHR